MNDGRPRPVAEGEVVSLLAVPPTRLELPPSSRPDGAPPAEQISLRGPWTYAGTVQGDMHKWAMPNPFRPRGLFFHAAQPGMKVLGPTGELPYKRYGPSDAPYWSHNKEMLFVFTPERGEGPADGEYRFVYPRADERERALNLALSGLAPERFVVAEIADDWDSRRGLLLPAPATAEWTLVVPPAAELQLTAGLVEPEVKDGASDGAELRVEVVSGTETFELTKVPLAVREWRPVRLDLSRWSGKEATVRLRTDPGASALYDYAFAAEPVIASRKEDPVTVLLVFIDTLRVDHLGLYGYERDTSPVLDALGKRAAVFENARTVAPWTLPSARSVITGLQPESYSEPSTRTLPAILSERGWATAMFAGNVYLSANFDMAKDWGMHRVGMWPRADVVTDDALAFLDEHQGRDVLIQVHYMDPHLPYNEPKSHRYLFAGEAKGGLREEFHLTDVRRVDTNPPEVRRYIMDRYDNNVRYATDQIQRLLERMDDNDIVVVFADHGEEFWDHHNFEHGHTLFEELIHVPLIIDGPGIDGSRVSAPASIMDITPTVLDMLGDDVSHLDGVSLAPIARDEPGATEALAGRQLAFGRPLYGSERWGVLTSDNKKWTTSEGREALYDLNEDPHEERNLIANQEGTAGAPYRDAFAEALGRPVVVGYRLWASACRGEPAHDLEAAMKVPGGVASAWVGADPLEKSSAEVSIVDDAVVARWHAGFSGERNIWVVPKLPIEQVTAGLVVEARQGDEVAVLTVPEGVPPGLGRLRIPLTRHKFDCRMLAVTLAITPMLADVGQLRANDPEMRDLLHALGYATKDEEPNKPQVSDEVRQMRQLRGEDPAAP